MKKIWRLIYSRAFIVLLLMLVTILTILWVVTSVTTYFPAFLAFLQIFSIIVAISIVNRPMNASFKLTWILFVMGIPIFGALFYFILQSNIETRRYRKNFQRQARILKEYGHTSYKVMSGLGEKDKEQLKLAHYMNEHVGYALHVNSDAKYYPSGEAWFEDLLQDLRQAENYIFMEYYIVDFGYMWDSILEILKEKVAQGVEVRFMYDGMNSLNTLPYSYYKELQKEGIKAKAFSQIIPALSTVQTNRDHRKITVIDGRIAYTGGANLADEYINRIVRFGYWKDANIKVTGEAVANFTLMFLQMWNFDEKTENSDLIYMEEHFQRESEVVESDSYFLAYGESPFDNDAVAKRVYLDMFHSAQNTIDIMTPYLVLDDEMQESLIYAAKRGVKVRILLPHIYDKQMPYLVARTDFEIYLRAGIEIYEFLPGFVHSKVVLVDDKKASVGTVNLDFRSFYLNFECGLYVYNHRQVMADISRDFEQSFAQSQRITLAGFRKYYPWYKRAAGAVIAMIAPLL